MTKLGCVEAMNLDGGGSTTFCLGGVVLNRPSDGGLRRVANAVALFAPQEGGASISIDAKTTTLKPGDVTTLRVMDASGAVVPQDQVVWTCQSGVGSVGGDGAFRASKAGSATVRAFARGVWTFTELNVSEN
jgi:hypothetical protein